MLSLLLVLFFGFTRDSVKYFLCIFLLWCFIWFSIFWVISFQFNSFASLIPSQKVTPNILIFSYYCVIFILVNLCLRFQIWLLFDKNIYNVKYCKVLPTWLCYVLFFTAIWLFQYNCLPMHWKTHILKDSCCCQVQSVTLSS